MDSQRAATTARARCLWLNALALVVSQPGPRIRGQSAYLTGHVLLWTMVVSIVPLVRSGHQRGGTRWRRKS